jgi:3-hydroxyisobutyrate dehydrogenase-like beta-hydroxyacid dehydrogenase
MATIGFVGVGKIGLPMCGNLIKAGHSVVGFPRGSLAEFQQLGGIAAGSGGSMQFGLRAPWMAQRRFLPQAGAAAGLAEYLHGAKALAAEVKVKIPLLDCLIDLYGRPSAGGMLRPSLKASRELTQRH